MTELRLWRITPVIALATVIALLSAGWLMARYVDRTNARQEVSEVTVQARILASTVTAALSFNDRQAAQEYVNAMRSNPQIEAVGIYDATGLFVSYPSGVTLPSTVAPAPAQFANDHLVVIVPVIQVGTVLGAVYLRSLTEPFAVRLQRDGVIGLLMIMASVVVAVLGVTHLTQRHHAEQLAAANEALTTQIAQREKVEEALRQSQKMEAIGQLTGGVAHDFNNLLQVILGNLERLGRRVPEVDSAAKLIDSATRAADRAATLTQRLLAFSRRQPLTPKALDLNDLVDGMLELFGRTLGETIQIETVFADGLWQVCADENQMENVLINLAVNARDAMPGGGRLTVETANVQHTDMSMLEDVRPGDYVLVAVRDTGTGMTKDVVARAFEPFFTTKEIGQGTGLGLSQVYGFVRQSGGYVWIDSTPGVGTTVTLYLPRYVMTTS